MIDGGEASLVSVPDNAERVDGNSRRHSRTTTLSFESQGSLQGTRHGATYYPALSRSSSSAQKSHSAAGRSMSKRPRTRSLQGHDRDLDRHRSEKRPEIHRKHVKPHRSDGMHPMDFGLSLLDEPNHIDPSLEAQIAELHRRVQNINPVSFPSLPSADVPSDHSHTTQPPPPAQYFAPVQAPPRISPTARTSSTSEKTRAATDSVSHASPHRRRRLSSIFTDVKDKLKVKPREPSAKQTHVKSVPSVEDSSYAVRYLQAENRMQEYREHAHPSTLERAEAAKAQLGARYAMVFDALARNQKPPNLLSVVKWRKALSDQRRHQIRSARSLVAESEAVSRSSAATVLGAQVPEVPHSFNPLKTIHENSPQYAEESASLQWLPYLASLHQKFLLPVPGRKEMKDWHVTAQVVADFVHRDQKQILDSTFLPSRPLHDNPAKSAPNSLNQLPLSPITSAEPSLASPIDLASPRSSFERDSRPTNVSQRSSARGFRASLAGLRDMPKGSLPSFFGPSSPPLNHNDFSPSSSRRDLARYRRDDAASVELSTDTDPELNIQLNLTSRAVEQSASEEDSRISRSQSLQPSRANSKRWAGPFFSRLTTSTNLNVADESCDGVSADVSAEQVAPPPLDYHAFTADFVTRFPRQQTPNEQLERSKREELEQRQEEQYAHRTVLLERVKAQNAHLDHLAKSAVAQAITLVQAMKVMRATLRLEPQDAPSDVFNMLAPFSDSQLSGWSRIEAEHAHRQQNLKILQDFFVSAQAGRIAWLHPDDNDCSSEAISSVVDGIDGLAQEWGDVEDRLGDLREAQDTLSDSVNRIRPVYEDVAMRIDTTYPELGRNVDFARQLSASRQTTLPYISTLPPWAREVLGPFIEYTLELIGILIRWLLYPLWRILPRWIQVAITFVALLAVSCIVMVVGLIVKYWTLSVSFGHFLSRFAVLRYIVLTIILFLNKLAAISRRNWRGVAVSTSLAIFWYITTPQDLD